MAWVVDGLLVFALLVKWICFDLKLKRTKIVRPVPLDKFYNLKTFIVILLKAGTVEQVLQSENIFVI